MLFLEEKRYTGWSYHVYFDQAYVYTSRTADKIVKQINFRACW